jgi:hypothetical protein
MGTAMMMMMISIDFQISFLCAPTLFCHKFPVEASPAEPPQPVQRAPLLPSVRPQGGSAQPRELHAAFPSTTTSRVYLTLFLFIHRKLPLFLFLKF